MLRSLPTVVVLLALVPSGVRGQQAPPPATTESQPVGIPTAQPALQSAGPEVIRLTLTPAGFPGGALRHRLLPEYLDRTPGNAATLYRRAMMAKLGLPIDRLKKYDELQALIDGKSTAELSPHECREALEHFVSLDDVDAAARREQCDWDLRMRELRGTEVIALLLPEAQEARNLGRALVVRFRLEIAEDRLDDAVRTLQTTLQLAQDVNKNPTLINSLVGVAISSMALHRLPEFLQHRESPNLYWSLTALPRPLIDATEAFEQERSMALQMFPILRDPTKPKSPDEWRTAMLESIQAFSDASQLSGDGGAQRKIMLAGLMMSGYPIAKQWFLDQGMDAKQIEAMPTAQVVAMYMAESYHFLWGEMFKNLYLPYPLAIKRARQFEQELASGSVEKRGPGKEILPIAKMLLPAISAATSAQARLDREVAVLRTIEALRLHAFENDGHWPESLDNITSVPVPVNPVTGEPFKYSLAGEIAVLELEAINDNPRTARRYELTVRK